MVSHPSFDFFFNYCSYIFAATAQALSRWFPQKQEKETRGIWLVEAEYD